MRSPKPRGFALAVFLTLMPVVAMLAWTYLKVGTSVRGQAITQERQVRAFQAAEAGIRSYLVTGKGSTFDLNGCKVEVALIGTKLESSATPEHSVQKVTVRLEIDKGFVVRRETNEEAR